MKPYLALAVVLLLSLPLAAEEKKGGTAQQKEEKAAATAQAPAQTPDSPLVAAAKRAKRDRSQTPVITDDMVKNSSGRLTTTDSAYNPPLPASVEPSSEVEQNERRAEARAAEAKQSAAEKTAQERRQQELKRKARLAGESEEYEDGVDDDTDPARLEYEREMADSQPKPAPQD